MGEMGQCVPIKISTLILSFQYYTAHRDNSHMMNIYHQISAYSDRHNRNLLHLALLFIRYDFFDLTLDHTEPALLAQLILSEYNTKHFTVIDQAVDHG